MRKLELFPAFFLLLVSCQGQDADAEDRGSDEVTVAVEYDLVTTLQHNDVLLSVFENPEDRFAIQLLFTRTNDDASKRFFIRPNLRPATHVISAAENIVFFLDRGRDLYLFNVRDFTHRVISLPADALGTDFLSAITQRDIALIARPAPTIVLNVNTGEYRLFQDIAAAYTAGETTIVESTSGDYVSFWPAEPVQLQDFESVEEVPYPSFANLRVVE